MAEKSVFSFKVLYEKLTLTIFALFFIAGNFFRLIPMPGFSNHVSVIELLFYLLCVPLYFSHFRKSQCVIVTILLSTCFGALLNGFDLMSTLYAFKLCAAIMGGCVLGALADKEYFLRLFVWVLALGLLIFFLFPQANAFFQFLEGYGVGFEGDPHQRRFISPFFDPNLYAAIGCIPLILAFVLQRRTLFFLFLMSIFLTFSRSGIATCIFLLIPMALLSLKKFSKSTLLYVPIGALILTASLFFYADELFYLFDRTFSIGQDPSAHARLITFSAGWDLFLQHPFFGVGYHYAAFHLEGFGLDSSLLIALIDFGFIPIGLFLAGLGVLASCKKKSPLFSWLLFYTLICIGFTSQFNNLLFYQYWLIPMIGLFAYESRTCT